MVDLSFTIAAKSDQLNADDLIDRPMTIKITRVTGRDSAEQPIAIHYEGDNGKPYMPCKTMRRLLVHIWKKDGTQYVGRSLTLYRDPEVAFGGLKVGGIRISHASHIDGPQTFALTATRGNKRPVTVKPLQAQQQAAPANAKERAAAEKWLGEYEAAVRNAPDMEAIEHIHATADRTLPQLQRQFPDLHTRALSLRTPPSTSADPDYGERFTDDDTAGRARAEVEEGL